MAGTIGEAIAESTEASELVTRLRAAADGARTYEDLVLVRRDDLLAAAAALDPKVDWTVSKDGRANSSAAYRHLRKEIERLIRADAHKLVAGRADMTAGLIVSQLAHVHHLRLPPE